MSAFAPDNYAEAKATHKPLSRRAPLRAVGRKGPTPFSTNPRANATGRGIARKGRGIKKRAKKAKVSTLKNKAWTQFSIFIRTKGADELGFNKCVTCDVRKFWKELQAGHFIRGRLNANLFDERGVWPQCYSCNVGAQGNVVIYYKVMLERFGQEVIDELLLQNNQTRKWLPGELQAIFEKYKALNGANPICQMVNEQ
jgi:hypothetical protein